MEGKLTYQEKSSELINSVEGWFITSDDGTNHYKVSTMSTEKINSGNYNFKSGDTVSYILKGALCPFFFWCILFSIRAFRCIKQSRLTTCRLIRLTCM